MCSKRKWGIETFINLQTVLQLSGKPSCLRLLDSDVQRFCASFSTILLTHSGHSKRWTTHSWYRIACFAKVWATMLGILSTSSSSIFTLSALDYDLYLFSPQESGRHGNICMSTSALISKLIFRELSPFIFKLLSLLIFKLYLIIHLI
jgi:hypothetical protein